MQAVTPDAMPRMLCDLAQNGLLGDLLLAANAQNCGLARQEDGATPLMCAAKTVKGPTEDHASCAKLLIELAPSENARYQMVNAIDRSGLSALHFAAEVDNVGVAEELIKAKARIHFKDVKGRTALLVAVERDSKAVAKLLLRAGADSQLADADQRSPLSVAAGSDNLEMTRILEMWLPSRKLTSEFQEVKTAERILLGRSTYSSVYAVETEPPNLNVVLRLVKKSEICREDEALFGAELKGLKALEIARQVNIVEHVKSTVGEDSIEMFIERVGGATLKELLETNKSPLVEVQIQNYLRQLASALCYLHSYSSGPIVHRDIKSDNVMITHGQTLKLIDFGFSRRMESNICASSAVLVGTACNMAPEIVGADNPEYSSKSDMWAVGCLLYYMATGVSPYEAKNLARLSVKISTEPVPEIGPAEKFSRGLHNLYKECMKKDPRERITALDMLFHDFMRFGVEGAVSILPEQEIRQWQEKVPKTLEAMNEISKLINESEKKATGAKIGTTVASVTGGIAAVVGFALLIPSFGAALPLAIAGTSVAVAGGAGTAAATVADAAVQRSEFKKATEIVGEFKLLSQALLLKCLSNIRYEVMRRIKDPRSGVNIADCKAVLRSLKKGIDDLKEKFKEGTEGDKKDAGNSARNDEQSDPIDEMFQGFLAPLEEVLRKMEDMENTDAMQTDVEEEVSAKFNHALQNAACFVVRILRIMMLGSADEESIIPLAKIRGSLCVFRLAVGGTQITTELATAIGRSLAGRVLGIAGSAVFTAIDLGSLVYYSVRLHQSNNGKNAAKADLIDGLADTFRKLLIESKNHFDW